MLRPKSTNNSEPLLNSNNSNELNKHKYANENYNQHGEYDPNFNAGLSSYDKDSVIEDKNEKTSVFIKNPLLQTQAEINHKKKVKKFLIILSCLLSAIVLIAVFTLILKKLDKKQTLTFENLNDTDSFFLRNEIGYYAMFNEDGKQLTNFDFKTVGSFFGGVAKVTTIDGKSALIKDDGRYLIEPNENNIYGSYSLFQVNDNGNYEVYSFNGKVIASGPNLDIDNYAYGSLFTIKKDNNIEVFNYAGYSLGFLPSDDYYSYYSYDGSYVTLINDKKTILYNIDKPEKVLELDGQYCLFDTSDTTVILSSCGTNQEKLYKVIQNGKEVYTINSSEQFLSLTDDGAVFMRERQSEYYKLLDEKGNVYIDDIIGYQSGKDYIVEFDNRLMFYHNGQRKNIVDCASYYQVAKDGLYIIKVDRYADGCRSDVNNRYTYYDLDGNPKSDSFYAAGRFNEGNRAIVSTDELENYVINDSFEVLGEAHYSMRAVGNLYIVWDEKHNQALIDMNAKVLEATVLSYKSYGSSSDDESYIIVEVKKGEHILYNSKSGEKIKTIKGNEIETYMHYFMVDGKYFSYRTGNQFYPKN